MMEKENVFLFILQIYNIHISENYIYFLIMLNSKNFKVTPDVTTMFLISHYYVLFLNTFIYFLSTT